MAHQGRKQLNLLAQFTSLPVFLATGVSSVGIFRILWSCLTHWLGGDDTKVGLLQFLLEEFWDVVSLREVNTRAFSIRQCSRRVTHDLLLTELHPYLPSLPLSRMMDSFLTFPCALF